MPISNRRSFEVTCSMLFASVLISLLTFPLASLSAEPITPATESVSSNVTLDARMDALADLPLDELRTKETEVEANIPKLAEQAQVLQKELRDLRIAGQQSEAVLAIRQEMVVLQKKIELVIDEIPDVKAKNEEAAKAKSALFEEMQFRTRLIGMIAAAERRAAEKQTTGSVKLDVREP